MSVEIEIIAFYGVELSFNPFQTREENEKFREELLESYLNDIDFVPDYMNGNYILVGKEFYNSGSSRWGDFEGDDWKEINIDKLGEIDREWRAIFYDKFPQYANLIIDKNSKFIVFQHVF